MEITLVYARPTQVATTAETTTIMLAANARRPSVAFAGRVRDPLLLRQLLLAQHRIAAAANDAEWRKALDPVVTVHPDQITFESYSSDGSCYARLTAAMSAFEAVGEPQAGSTNVDFTWDLAPALNTIRSSHATALVIGPAAEGAATFERADRLADLPAAWVKGLLQVQGALTAHPFTFPVRPIDLAAVITYLDEHVTRRSPQGIRYEFVPNAPMQIVLEPWEKRFPLRGTHYTGFARTVRLWGRKRLALLRPVLPYADRVTVAILGRGLPHVYICHCGPYQFLLAVSGWAADDWTMGSGFDLLAAFTGATAERTQRVYQFLADRLTARREEIALGTGIPGTEVEQALFQLSRAGKVLYDPLSGQYRARDLFAEPLDLAALFVADPRLEAAQTLLEAGQVQIQAVRQGGSRVRPETRIFALVHDDIDYAVTVQLDENGRLRYGRCQCTFFRMNTLTRGPCAHILAARLAFDMPADQLADQPADSAENVDDADDLDDDDAADEAADTTDTADDDMPF
jgi:hypothetical protein